MRVTHNVTECQSRGQVERSKVASAPLGAMRGCAANAEVLSQGL